MNTFGMILTLVGFSSCWTGGIFGWAGMILAAVGLGLGVRGMTDVGTSPAGLGMDTASFAFGPAALIYGIAFQIKIAEAPLGFLLIQQGLFVMSVCAVLFYTGFIVLLLVARKRARLPLALGATAFLVAALIFGISSLILADGQGMRFL